MDLWQDYLDLAVTYATPQPYVESESVLHHSTESTKLVPLEDVTSSLFTRQHTFTGGGVSVDLDYDLARLVFGAPMVGIFDTKSFALSAWNAPTVITGLTAEPLSVDGDFARTYDSNRHNFFECVLITPESDPSLPESQRTELRDSNVKSILVEAWTSSGTPQIQSIRILGFDDSLRQLE